MILNYIDKFLPGVSENPQEAALRFLHDHPRYLQTARIALNALGCIATAYACSAQSITTGAFGLATIWGTKYVSQKLSIYGINPHSMSDHAFTPKQCDGGRLYYQGDVPVLSLDTDIPYDAGRAHGYLLAPQLIQLLGRISENVPHLKSEKETLDAVQKRIPPSYLAELQGIVDGANEWIDEQWFFSKPSKVTMDQLLLANILPEVAHLYWKEDQRSLLNGSGVACTVVIGKNEDSDLIFGRNLDWPSFGLIGECSLVIYRTTSTLQTAEISVPGLVGTLTGMNEKGFALAMNTCPPSHIEYRGTPAMMINRMALEKCSSVRQANRFFAKCFPIAPYHITLADPNGAKSIHFYQDRGLLNASRDLCRENPLITTNCSYSGEGKSNRDDDMLESFERHRILKSYFKAPSNKEADLETLIADSLTLTPVNNSATIHTVQMIPKQRKMSIALDNSFSADQQMQEVDLNKLFT